MYALLENCNAAPNANRPVKTSDVLVVGRSHEFVEDERKFKIPVKCAYCDGVVQGEWVWSLHVFYCVGAIRKCL